MAPPRGSRAHVSSAHLMLPVVNPGVFGDAGFQYSFQCPNRVAFIHAVALQADLVTDQPWVSAAVVGVASIAVKAVSDSFTNLAFCSLMSPLPSPGCRSMAAGIVTVAMRCCVGHTQCPSPCARCPESPLHGTGRRAR